MVEWVQTQGDSLTLLMMILYRLMAIAGGLGDAVAFLVGFEPHELGEAWKLLATPAVSSGMITAGLVVAAWGMWPGIRWVWDYPARKRAQREEAKRQAKESMRIMEQAANEEAVDMMVELRFFCLPQTKRSPHELYNYALKTKEEEEARSKILAQKLSVLGLALPNGYENPSSEDWEKHLSLFLPYVREYGIERAHTEIMQYYGPGSSLNTTVSDPGS